MTEFLEGISLFPLVLTFGTYQIGLWCQKNTKSALCNPLLIAVVLIFLIMVAQFAGFLAPFIIMFTIPLAFTGGFLALMIAGMELSMVSMMGFLMLAGVIVNNGIVFVDYVNKLRLAGVAKTDALVRTGKSRMRPILMTTLTTVFAMLVMAIFKNPWVAILVGVFALKEIIMLIVGLYIYHKGNNLKFHRRNNEHKAHSYAHRQGF